MTLEKVTTTITHMIMFSYYTSKGLSIKGYRTTMNRAAQKRLVVNKANSPQMLIRFTDECFKEILKLAKEEVIKTLKRI